MQGARRGTGSRVSRIRPWDEGRGSTMEPPGDPLNILFINCDVCHVKRFVSFRSEVGWRWRNDIFSSQGCGEEARARFLLAWRWLRQGCAGARARAGPEWSWRLFPRGHHWAQLPAETRPKRKPTEREHITDVSVSNSSWGDAPCFYLTSLSIISPEGLIIWSLASRQLFIIYLKKKKICV